MVGEYPLLIDGKETGKIKVTQKGLKYCFEAYHKGTNSVIRLSVFGGDRAGYLGVMQPYKNGLRLYREFSKSELQNFPQKIEYASNEKLVKSINETTYENDIIWRRNSVGLLWAVQNGQRLCAIPKHFGIAAYGEELQSRNIEGVEHRIFQLKNGKN